MENPPKNEETANVFARYLEKEYGWKYKAVLPEVKNEPLFDAKLVSLEHEELKLQMKQMIQGDVEFMRSQRGESGMGNPGKDWKMFKNIQLNLLVKKSENKYKERAKNLILILHVDDSYFIPSDTDSMKKNDFKESSFKGIYVISLKHELFKANSEKKFQDEFVFKIKNAFNFN
ncbi:MAG: hypothetical protein AAB503_02410 [Patescibacteria group bacterium]